MRSTEQTCKCAHEVGGLATRTQQHRGLFVHHHWYVCILGDKYATVHIISEMRNKQCARKPANSVVATAAAFAPKDAKSGQKVGPQNINNQDQFKPM